MTESYPELRPGTLYTNNYGLWCVVDRRECEWSPDEFDEIEIEVMAINTSSMVKGGRQWIHEDDVGSAGAGDFEIVDDEEITELVG